MCGCWQVLATGVERRPVWLGAASFDRSVGVSHRTGQITHHIDPDLDTERQVFIDSLTAAGVVAQIYQVTGIGPTLAGRNGGGDRYFTDGEISLGVLRPDLAPSATPPERRPSSRRGGLQAARFGRRLSPRYAPCRSCRAAEHSDAQRAAELEPQLLVERDRASVGAVDVQEASRRDRGYGARRRRPGPASSRGRDGRDGCTRP